jgi:Domain of unknown function (DUF222)
VSEILDRYVDAGGVLTDTANHASAYTPLLTGRYTRADNPLPAKYGHVGTMPSPHPGVPAGRGTCRCRNNAVVTAKVVVQVCEGGVVREALVRVQEAVDDCLDLPAWALCGQDLLDCLDAAWAVQQKVNALLLGLIREIDGAGLAREQGATCTAAWLRGRLHLSPGAARLLVGDAERFDAGPAAVRDAVAAGTVNLEQARIIATTVETVGREAGAAAADKAVGLLLNWAGEVDPDGLRTLAGRILEHVAPEVAEEAQRRALQAAEERDQRDRYLNLSPQPEGRVRLSGLLDVETGALLRTVLDPLTRPHGQADDRTPGQRRHDALAEVCRLALRTGDLPDSGGGEPAQLVVTTSYDVMVGQLGAGMLDTGQTLSAESVRRLACDAQILPAVLGGNSQILDLGRQRRLFTGPIRRALVLRDRGCAFPACDRPPRWTAAHHVVHWSAGGKTAVDNGVLLCGRHHRVVHHDGWQVRIAADRHPEFTPPPWIDPRQQPRRNTYHRRC